MKSSILALFLFALLIVSRPTLAFEDMVRHGYMSCTSCHFNPNGGGILRPFGRVISEDVLSTWGTEGEGKFAYGVLGELPEGFHLGGDARAVQTHRRTETFKEGRFILMQLDAEALYELEEWVADATIGWDNGPSSGVISRRHSVMYRPTKELRLQVLAGKFQQAYGLNLPDHIVSVKRGLGWDEGTETYNVQAAWLEQTYDLFLTANFGRLDSPSLGREKGLALRGRKYLGDRARAGMSYFFGTAEKADRHVFGPFMSLGLSESTTILAELDFQKRFPAAGASTWGLASYLKVSHEIHKGVHLFGTQEYSKTDFLDPSSEILSFGVGAQFFPRPHYELAASWQKMKNQRTSGQFQDLIWILMHIYL